MQYLKKHISDCVLSCLSALGCFWDDTHATKAQVGWALSEASYHTQCCRSSNLLADTTLLPMLYLCRDLLPFSSPFARPFFIQPDSHHLLRLTSGSFLKQSFQSLQAGLWSYSRICYMLWMPLPFTS